VQFGDSKIAPVGSDSGEFAKKMLDEYMKSFIKRNTNLKVFNAVLHMDEGELLRYTAYPQSTIPWQL
jgi:hypothetical protein